MHASPKIESIQVSVYTVPTETPESDGTFQWDKTSLVVVEILAGGLKGLGYSYADAATAHLIDASLAPKLVGYTALAIGACWREMVEQIRNLGRPGIASMAIAAVDNALWDLKGKILDVSVAALLGLVRTGILAYGSGGFTSYSDAQLRKQLGGWAEAGFRAVKMKIGRDASGDIDRVRVARQAIGPGVQLFVDANGAYARKQALYQAHRFRDHDVTWFEEPVSSDDLEGLRLIRDHGPAGMDIAAGEYGYDAWYFRRMLEAGAVDVLQADATRCAGITGFLAADGLCASRSMPLSAHTAPSIHAHACCGAQRAINVEYFYDHARIEKMAFDGALEIKDGLLRPDLTRPGFGLIFKQPDMQPYLVYSSSSKT
ncbi:MAG TPA: enolase C-terminal domain-like protein [Bryobacteraceae bacterium]|jgi:L-alanine-DL-glutamate epimerase-like enolase superfamily enzyme|nr:enolase C-terminal domain-like protein [Bryobacteraceae bacterium]